MRIVTVKDLGDTIRSYVDPDMSGEFAEEVDHFVGILNEELKYVPCSVVLLWDSAQGKDFPLDLQDHSLHSESLLNMEWYGVDRLERDGQKLFMLWYGGSSLASAGEFYIIPVTH